MALTDTKLRKYLSKSQDNEVVISDRDGLSVRISTFLKMPLYHGNIVTALTTKLRD